MHNNSLIPDHFIRFFLKVSILTIFFVIIWAIVYYKPHIPYNDHGPEKVLNIANPGRASTWETDTQAAGEDVDLFIDSTVTELVKDPSHGSAPQFAQAQQRYNQVCSKYETICNKTYRKGSYTINEKLAYQAIIIHLLNKAGGYLESDLERKITSVSINSSSLGRRGSAGHKYIKMNVELIPNAQEFREVLSHELGHIVDFAHLQGDALQKSTTYTEFGHVQRPIDDPSLTYYKISWINENTRKPQASYKDFVSGYGMRGMYEDFAEAHNLWLNHNTYFQKLARQNTTIKRKYDYFSDVYNGNYYSNLTHKTPPSNERAWDTTRLHE